MNRAMRVLLLAVFATASVASAATEQQKRAAINKGLVWLATNQAADGHWGSSCGTSGYVAATGSGALAFIEEGFVAGSPVIIDTGTGPVDYGDVVGKAVNYLFKQAKKDTHSGAPSQNLYFRTDTNWSEAYDRSVYTTGVVTPVVYALGKSNPDAVINYPANTAVHNKSYKQVMQEVMNWFTWGQNADGGWRYYPNYGGSDNSTAQWGALPYLYGNSWALSTPASVTSASTGLERWTNIVQNTITGDWKDGGSGYNNMDTYVNMAKTGGILLEFAVLGKGISDPDVQAALSYMGSMVGFDHWNQPVGYSSAQWYGGHLDNPYAMWAVFKGLETYGGLVTNDNGTPGDTSDDFLVGDPSLVPTAPGGFTIGQDWATQTSAAGDWYSHYCDLLVGLQQSDGRWRGYPADSGYPYWNGALATGWYINILNATGAPEPVYVIPEPLTMLGVFAGVAGLGGYLRRRFT